jgi:hypothetical protein
MPEFLQVKTERPMIEPPTASDVAGKCVEAPPLPHLTGGRSAKSPIVPLWALLMFVGLLSISLLTIYLSSNTSGRARANVIFWTGITSLIFSGAFLAAYIFKHASRNGKGTPNE